MTFTEIRNSIKNYLVLDKSDRQVDELLKDFVNEAVEDFARMRDWKWLKKIETLTLDGSGEYTISTFLTEHFVREVALLIPYDSTIQLTTSSTLQTTAKTEFTKYNYKSYIQLETKAYTWAIQGDTLYVSGESGSLKMQYISAGANYPFTLDADTDNVLTYYDDIIKRMAAMYYLESIDDKEAYEKENRIIVRKLTQLKSSEKLGEHSGKFHHVRR